MWERAKSVIGGVAAAAMVGATALTPVPADAQPGYQQSMVQMVGWDPKHHGDWNGGNNWNQNNWNHHDGHHHNDWVGPAIGFGAGILLGSILAQPHYGPAPRYVAPAYGYYSYPTADAYCQYRTYNSYTKTYIGYDGEQHYCRIP
jgi:hypothetical protein